MNIQDKCGRSALHHAAVKGQDQVTEFLIENGINVANCDRQDRRALHWAASAGHRLIFLTHLPTQMPYFWLKLLF